MILKLNQGIHKPYEKRPLMSKFQAHWSGGIVYNIPVQKNTSSRFRLVFHNEDTDDTVINFKHYGVTAGFDIGTPTDDDKEIFPMYDVTSHLLWDPQYPIHAKNKKAADLSHGWNQSSIIL